ncbi:MAG: tetratricopeptide repeat protein [Lachnospirales bacterium]
MSAGFLYSQDGVLALKNGNVELAIRNFERAIKNDPKNPDGYRELGDLYQKQGKYQEALDIYNEYLEINDNAFFALYEKAKVLSSMKKFKEENHVLEQLMLKRSAYPGLALAYTKNLFALEDYIEAKKVLNDAIISNPSDESLRLFRAKMHQNNKDLKRACEDYKYLMNQFFKRTTYYIPFAKLSMELGNFIDAESALRFALKLDSENQELNEIYNEIPVEYKKS